MRSAIVVLKGEFVIYIFLNRIKKSDFVISSYLNRINHPVCLYVMVTQWIVLWIEMSVICSKSEWNWAPPFVSWSTRALRCSSKTSTQGYRVHTAARLVLAIITPAKKLNHCWCTISAQHMNARITPLSQSPMPLCFKSKQGLLYALQSSVVAVQN